MLNITMFTNEIIVTPKKTLHHLLNSAEIYMLLIINIPTRTVNTYSGLSVSFMIQNF